MSSSHLMTDDEFDAFWSRREARFTPLSEVYVEASDEEEAEALVVSMLARSHQVQMVSVSPSRINKGAARGRTARSNRCGSCAACNARDCGTCKNCRDKPRFGGPGIKKKACLARICRNTTRAGDDDDEDDSQPQYHEQEHKFHIDVEVAESAAAYDHATLSSIIDACKRQPLTPLRHSTSSSNLQGFDMLAGTALQTIPC